MDRNHDGVVTIDEFIDCCRCDQAITNSMLVFDSTIWPSGREQGRISAPSKDHERQPPAQNRVNELNVHTSSSTTVLCGNGSAKSSLPASQNHKDLSSSFGANSKRHGPPPTQQQQYQHHLHHPLNAIGNKTKNNVGHKASQTKRIQLSTAAKRCKSMKGSVDNNNSKTINLDDICKAGGTKEDDDCVMAINTPNQRQNFDPEAIASISTTTKSIESPTLVKVKTWYTESSVPLPPSTEGPTFWFWILSPSYNRNFQRNSRATVNDDKETKFKLFYDLWHFAFHLTVLLYPNFLNTLWNDARHDGTLLSTCQNFLLLKRMIAFMNLKLKIFLRRNDFL